MLAESLGGVHSYLIESPALMTHSQIAVEIRNKLEIDHNLIRFSTGIEGIDNLTKDIE